MYIISQKLGYLAAYTDLPGKQLIRMGVNGFPIRLDGSWISP
jgi:hypothetical protein